MFTPPRTIYMCLVGEFIGRFLYYLEYLVTTSFTYKLIIWKYGGWSQSLHSAEQNLPAKAFYNRIKHLKFPLPGYIEQWRNPIAISTQYFFASWVRDSSWERCRHSPGEFYATLWPESDQFAVLSLSCHLLFYMPTYRNAPRDTFYF